MFSPLTSKSPSRFGRRAFAIREAVALAAAGGLLLSLAIPLIARADNDSRFTSCMQRLKLFGISNAKFANDHADRIATLQSKNSQTLRYEGLGMTLTYGNSANDEMASLADQAYDIIIRRGNRPDLRRVSIPWIPNSRYSHLVMADYEGLSLPSSRWACPADASLLAWQSDPRNFNNLGVPSPVAPGALSNADSRWAYTSSYNAGTPVWSNDRSSTTAGAWFMNNATSLERRGGVTPNRGDVGHRRMSEVAYPERKAHMWDTAARHFVPRAVYWNFEETKQPILYFDGATRTTRTGATARGWDYNVPDWPERTHSYTYSITSASQEWMPGFPGGQAQGTRTFNAAYFATTREGLRGFDLSR